jgi:molybdenum cofactor synthesis domain-containing protein
MTSQSAPPVRSAEVIAVGSELLGSTRLDTNSLYISERLSAIGIELRSKTVVGDNLVLLADLCRQALTRVDLVVVTGGLGPTDDDLTREAIAGGGQAAPGACGSRGGHCGAVREAGAEDA